VGALAATFVVSAQVRERLRFVARELLGSRRRAQYRLRGADLRVWLRHGTPDIQNFDEIFYQALYSPPEPVAAALAGVTDATVVDLGANIGLAGAYFLGKLEVGSVVAFEPDPANADVHEQTIRANSLGDRWRLVRACAAVRDGELPFATGGFAESHVVEEPAGEDVTRLPAVDVFPELEQADVVKIDIEGGEWPILLDERFRSVPASVLVLEYHAHLCPEDDPPAVAERALRGAGYEISSIFNEPDGTGMVWAWRQAP